MSDVIVNGNGEVNVDEAEDVNVNGGGTTNVTIEGGGGIPVVADHTQLPLDGSLLMAIFEPVLVIKNDPAGAGDPDSNRVLLVFTEFGRVSGSPGISHVAVGWTTSKLENLLLGDGTGPLPDGQYGIG